LRSALPLSEKPTSPPDEFAAIGKRLAIEIQHAA
jgi:hypothetical protein